MVDKIRLFQILCNELYQQKFEFDVVSFTFDKSVIIQSKELCENNAGYKLYSKA